MYELCHKNVTCDLDGPLKQQPFMFFSLKPYMHLYCCIDNGSCKIFGRIGHSFNDVKMVTFTKRCNLLALLFPVFSVDHYGSLHLQ